MAKRILTAQSASTMMKTRLIIGCSIIAFCLVGCGGDSDPDQSVSKDEYRDGGKADEFGPDFCEEFGWYGDGQCDDFCPKPDPDCEVEDGEVYESLGTVFTCEEVGGQCGEICGEGAAPFNFTSMTGCAGDSVCCTTETRISSFCEGNGGIWNSEDRWWGRVQLVGERVLVSWARGSTGNVEYEITYEITSSEAGTSYMPGTQFIKGNYLRGTMPFSSNPAEEATVIDVRVPNTLSYSYYGSGGDGSTAFFARDNPNSFAGHTFLGGCKFNER